ncbi:hypothetical protein MLD38_036369 [Melastoma candidum]|uniref:Uncharacterized protein n=1 Tax=Melastoma candidum TaxID=119954 RepID=A0ACB9LJC3_9MYRT|nr:hypothetical protein MLD38_036369 [Melastoma candidum]
MIINHIAFGIASSSKLWPGRKEYVKTRWLPGRMQGMAWLDGPLKNTTAENALLPPMRLSGNTSSFEYRNRKGHRSAIRIPWIISETFRMTETAEGIWWFVMGDDDAVFVPDNLVRVLWRYDHGGSWYIGSNSNSESHIQNMEFSYNMAYGGGFDVYGNPFGLLAAHPVTPLVSLHHLDLIEPIFPNMTRVRALRKLWVRQGYGSAALMQQSICYDPSRSAGPCPSPGDMRFSSFGGIHPLRRSSCLVGRSWTAQHGLGNDTTVSRYPRYQEPDQPCKWKMANPSRIERVVVHNKSDPNMWDKLEWHPLTISSDRSLEQDKLSIVIMCEMFPPVGSPWHEKLVMVSGGSGMTPFFSILRGLIHMSAAHNESTLELILISTFKNSRDLSMLDLLLPMANSQTDLSNLLLKIEGYVTRESGFSSDNQGKYRTICSDQTKQMNPLSPV